MEKIKFFTLPTDKAKDVNIFIRFTNGRLFDIKAKSTLIIYSKYWNSTTGKVRAWNEFLDAEELQSDLDSLETAIKKEYKSNPDKSKINKKWLLTAIDKHFNPNKYLQTDTLFGYIQDFINTSDQRPNKKGGTISYKMKREYIVTFRYLKEYANENKEPDFIDMNLDFHNDFTTFLRNKGLALNTIAKKIQTLKVFLNDAYLKDKNPYLKFKDIFKAKTEDSDNFYLNEDEITQLYRYDFSDEPRLEKVRDLFILDCWIGLRYSDLKQLTPDKIKGKFIEINPGKTGNKVIIPIHHTVKEIINKYNGKLPDPISNQKYNDYLKEASKLAGIDGVFYKAYTVYGKKIEKKYLKHEIISSHVARRSFCTNSYKAKIPTLTIMSISGHRTETAFLQYIKVTKQEHAEMMLEVWNDQRNHLKVAK